MSDKEYMPEKMDDFFTARLDMYEDHMLTVIGIQCYEKIAELVPAETLTLLDLGCGTGLELDYLFKRLPDISVTGIDMTRSMLDQLISKHPDKDIRLICGDYLTTDLGENLYDTAISFQTMHHLLRNDKVKVYKNILRALKPGGLYLEADFSSLDQADEDAWMERSRKLREETNIAGNEHYHIDIPYTADHILEMFEEAGFIKVEVVLHPAENGNTAMIRGYKPNPAE